MRTELALGALNASARLVIALDYGAGGANGSAADLYVSEATDVRLALVGARARADLALDLDGDAHDALSLARLATAPAGCVLGLMRRANVTSLALRELTIAEARLGVATTRPRTYIQTEDRLVLPDEASPS